MLAKLLVEYQRNDNALSSSAHQHNLPHGQGKYVCDLSIDDSAYLRWAAIKGDYDIAKLLLESYDESGKPRCDVNAADNDALRLATKYNHTRVIELLQTHQKIKER